MVLVGITNKVIEFRLLGEVMHLVLRTVTALGVSPATLCAPREPLVLVQVHLIDVVTCMNYGTRI